MDLLLNALAALLASWLVRWLARRVSGELPGELAPEVEAWSRVTLRLLVEAAAVWAAGRIRRAPPAGRGGREIPGRVPRREGGRRFPRTRVRPRRGRMARKAWRRRH